jgi:hypothetical protein
VLHRTQIPLGFSCAVELGRWEAGETYMREISAIVFALSIWTCNVVYSAPVELNTTDINDLNKIAALREAEMDKHSVQYLEAQIESPVCPVGALRRGLVCEGREKYTNSL